METIISPESTGGHIINKYNFKVLPSSAPSSKTKESVLVSGESSEEQSVDTGVVSGEGSDLSEETVLNKSSKDELIESLLQKTDEMSSNFIKMQMKLEAKDQEYQEALAKAKAEAFEEGKAAGHKEAGDIASGELANATQQFVTSIQTLDTSTKEFSNSIAGIQEELIHAALDIAKEIVLIEVSEKGNEIARELAERLIKEIQTSSAVTLKVNPSNKVSIEQALGTLENVSIISDNAVSEGGVVVLSDAGNIDGNIMKRYERVKSAALDK